MTRQRRSVGRSRGFYISDPYWYYQAAKDSFRAAKKALESAPRSGMVEHVGKEIRRLKAEGKWLVKQEKKALLKLKSSGNLSMQSGNLGTQAKVLKRFRKSKEKKPSKFAKRVQAIIADEQADSHFLKIDRFIASAGENQWNWVNQDSTGNPMTLGGLREILHTASVLFNGKGPSSSPNTAAGNLTASSVIKVEQGTIVFEMFNNSQHSKKIKIYVCKPRMFVQSESDSPYNLLTAYFTKNGSVKTNGTTSIATLDPYVAQAKELHEVWSVEEVEIHMEPGSRHKFAKSIPNREYDISKYNNGSGDQTLPPGGYIPGQYYFMFSYINDFTTMHNKTTNVLAGVHYPPDPIREGLCCVIKKSYKIVCPDSAPLASNVYGFIKYNALDTLGTSNATNKIDDNNPQSLMDIADQDMA